VAIAAVIVVAVAVSAVGLAGSNQAGGFLQPLPAANPASGVSLASAANLVVLVANLVVLVANLAVLVANPVVLAVEVWTPIATSFGYNNRTAAPVTRSIGRELPQIHATEEIEWPNSLAWTPTR
jgi:hypothetical protein